MIISACAKCDYRDAFKKLHHYATTTFELIFFMQFNKLSSVARDHSDVFDYGVVTSMRTINKLLFALF